VSVPVSVRWCTTSVDPVQTPLQVGLGLVLHEADNLIDTSGIPLDDIVAIGLLLFFGIRTLQVCALPIRPASHHRQTCNKKDCCV
jgi:hypothetical protein